MQTFKMQDYDLTSLSLTESLNTDGGSNPVTDAVRAFIKTILELADIHIL
jgi:hypothetical protein